MQFKRTHKTNTGHQTCLLRADVFEHEQTAEPSAYSLLGDPIRRRINRLERTAVSYFGKIISRTSHGLLVMFESAEAAVRGASEMQKYCAQIPQISGSKYGIEIRIDLANIEHFSANLARYSKSSTCRLAKQLGDSCIIVANELVPRLTPATRKDVYTITEANLRSVLHAVNWRDEPPIASARLQFSPYAAEVFKQPTPSSIVLRLAGVSTRFDSTQAEIRIGRAPDSDIVITHNKASRSHCRISYQATGYFLIDASANGTCITSSEGNELKVSQDQASLKGQGWITLGQRYHQNSQFRIEFEVIQTFPEMPG